MAKSRKPVSSFDLTGIAYDVIEKDRELEETSRTKDEPAAVVEVPTKSSPAATPRMGNSFVSKERALSPKMTGVRLYCDQLDTLMEIEYREKRRNIISEILRTALDEYFERHNYA